MEIKLTYPQLRELEKLINAYEAVEKEAVSSGEITLYGQEKTSVSWDIGPAPIVLQIPDA